MESCLSQRAQRLRRTLSGTQKDQRRGELSIYRVTWIHLLHFSILGCRISGELFCLSIDIYSDRFPITGTFLSILLPRFPNRNLIRFTCSFFILVTRISKKICAIGVTRPRPCSTATLRLTITTWNRLNWPAATRLGNEAKWTNLDVKTNIIHHLFLFCVQVPKW